MAKKGKGFFGSIGSFLGSIPAVGKVKNAAKSVKKKIKNTKKKLKKAIKKAKKKLKKKLKKKIGKVFTKARKLKNNLSKSKMVKKFKRTAKKVVLAAKQAAKKTSTKVKQAVKEVKAKVKETVVPLKPSKGKVEKISKKVGNKIQGEAELAKFFDEYLKDRKTVGPIGNKYSVQDGNPLTTLQDKQRVLGGGNHSRTKKSTAVDQFIYSLLIEDYVTLVDPKATLGEKALAGLSMVPIFKPVKAVDAAYDTAKIYNKTRVIENVNDSKKIRASSNFNNYKNKEKEVLENIKNSAKKVEVTEQDSKQLAEYAKSLDKGTGNLKSQGLMDELANSGVKYNPNDVVAVTKNADGKIVWLENGNSQAGFNHILNHADEFATKGITQRQLPEFITKAVSEGKIVGYQGKGTGRPIYEINFNGQTQRVAITTGSNGFIVGANPVSIK